jgi:hypothetical protein
MPRSPDVGTPDGARPMTRKRPTQPVQMKFRLQQRQRAAIAHRARKNGHSMAGELGRMIDMALAPGEWPSVMGALEAAIKGSAQ